jgi:hypothetical protein
MKEEALSSFEVLFRHFPGRTTENNSITCLQTEIWTRDLPIAKNNIFYSNSGGGGSVVQLGWRGTSATKLTYCIYPGWLWWWRIWWNDDWQGKPKYSENTCPGATLSTTNPTWPARVRIPVAAVGSQRLTALAMPRPFFFILFVSLLALRPLLAYCASFGW